MTHSLQPGFVFTAEDPFTGIDLDGCRNPETGEFAQWARDIILQAKSYTEVSPSQTGVKIFCRGALPANAKWNLDQPKISDKRPGIELYDHERYFTVTGWRLAGVPETINDAQTAIDSLLASRPVKHIPKTDKTVTEQDIVERASRYVARMPAAVSGARGHDRTYHVACVLVLGFGLDDSDAMAVLLEYNQRCEPPWSEKELQHKIDGAKKESGDRNFLRFAARDEIYAVRVPQYSESQQKPGPTVSVGSLHEAANQYLDTIREGRTTLIETGVPGLDAALAGGLDPGEMMIMAARPSHGKSAVALQIVHHWTSIGLPTLFVSEEMSALSLGKRAIQFASQIHQHYWTASLDKVQQHVAEHFASRAPCFIAEGCRNIAKVYDVVKKQVEQNQIKCLVVDYAQLLDGQGGNRFEKISNVSVGLRRIASEFKLVTVVLCQLNRAIEAREHFLPKMSDIRETGQLEQDADVIVFNVWPWKVDPKQEKYRYQFFVCKNRNREIAHNHVDCTFDPSRQMFLDAESATGEKSPDWND